MKAILYPIPGEMFGLKYHQEKAEIHLVLTAKEAEFLGAVLNEVTCVVNMDSDDAAIVQEGIEALEKCSTELQERIAKLTNESSEHTVRES
jgi:hypothetical protein